MKAIYVISMLLFCYGAADAFDDPAFIRDGAQRGNVYQYDDILMNKSGNAQLHLSTGGDYYKLAGTIVDREGTPLKDYYVIAFSESRIRAIPDYISAWTDSDGRYALYLPAGRYYISSAAEFPPALKNKMFNELIIDADPPDFNIRVSRKVRAPENTGSINLK